MRTACWPYLPGGSAPEGGLLLRGLSAPRGLSGPGGCLLLGGSAIQQALRQTPPVNRMTDRQVQKHNLRKLRLRAVIISGQSTLNLLIKILNLIGRFGPIAMMS